MVSTVAPDNHAQKRRQADRQDAEPLAVRAQANVHRSEKAFRSFSLQWEETPVGPTQATSARVETTPTPNKERRVQHDCLQWFRERALYIFAVGLLQQPHRGHSGAVNASVVQQQVGPGQRPHNGEKRVRG